MGGEIEPQRPIGQVVEIIIIPGAILRLMV
jgi:hypothetical protein